MLAINTHDVLPGIDFDERIKSSLNESNLDLSNQNSRYIEDNNNPIPDFLRRPVLESRNNNDQSKPKTNIGDLNKI